MRRWKGSDLGEQYQEILAFDADGDHSQPEVLDRTLGDHLDSTRTGSAQSLVNGATMRAEVDAAGWSFPRLVGFVAQIERSE